MAPIKVVVRVKAVYNGLDHKAIGVCEPGAIISIHDGPYFESLRASGFVEEYLDVDRELDTLELDAHQIRSQRYDLTKMHIAKLRSLAATLGMEDSVKKSKSELINFVREAQSVSSE